MAIPIYPQRSEKEMKVLKIPFDLGSVKKDKRGSSEAPDIIEKEYSNIPNAPEAKFVNVEVAHDFETTSKNIIEAAKNQDKIIAVGGDHSISYGLMKAFSEKFPNSGLIVFDAHLDCEDDFLPPDHEDILHAAVKEKLFKKILVIGVRNYTKKQQEFAMNNFSWDSAEMSIDAIKQHIKEILDQVDNIYISIDIDVFDPEFAPGTGYLEKNGLKPEEVLPVIRNLKASGKVKGFDITEVSPKFDNNNITSKLAAKILAEFLQPV